MPTLEITPNRNHKPNKEKELKPPLEDSLTEWRVIEPDTSPARRRLGAGALKKLLAQREPELTDSMRRIVEINDAMNTNLLVLDESEVARTQPETESEQSVPVPEAVDTLTRHYPGLGELVPKKYIGGDRGQRVVQPAAIERYDIKVEKQTAVRGEFRHPRRGEVVYGKQVGAVENMRGRVDEARRTAKYRAGRFGRAVIARSVSAAETAKDIAGATALALTGGAARELEVTRKYGPDVLNMPQKEREEWISFVDSLPSNGKFLDSRIAPGKINRRVRRTAGKFGLVETPGTPKGTSEKDKRRMAQRYKGRHRRPQRLQYR